MIVAKPFPSGGGVSLVAGTVLSDKEMVSVAATGLGFALAPVEVLVWCTRVNPKNRLNSKSRQTFLFVEGTRALLFPRLRGDVRRPSEAGAGFMVLAQQWATEKENPNHRWPLIPFYSVV